MYFRNRVEASKKLAEVGLELGSLSLKHAEEAYTAKLNKRAGKPSFSKPVMVAKPALAAKAPVINVIDNLKVAAKSARTASAKVEAYSQLVAKLHANLAAEKDAVAQTEIRRELMAAQKSEAYARLAERQSNPGAESIRRALAQADE